ncbi:MAG: hypothetical protein MI824_16910 [Hyphomicrobiales bacterium]|nr:hypothetical protein [Hyphomicrobiales bacterium]
MKQKDRRYFDEKDIPDDVWSVLRTASVLNVGEFRVFQLAHKEWYAEEADEKTIERFFTQYMFNEIVPLWVRHFCQKVLRLEDEGMLDPAALGIVSPQQASREQKWRGVEATFWIFGSLLILIFIAEIASRISELACRFPPCG